MIYKQGFKFWLEELSSDIFAVSMKFEGEEITRDDRVEVVKDLDYIINELNQLKSEVEASKIQSEKSNHRN